MSTLKRIFGRAKRLSGSPQRESKNSSHKNLDARTANTIASERPSIEPDEGSSSLVSSEDNTHDAWRSSKHDDETSEGARSSRTTLTPREMLSPPMEHSSMKKSAVGCETDDLAVASGSGRDVAGKDVPAVPNSCLQGSGTGAGTEQPPWTDLPADQPMNDTYQEITIVVVPRVVDSVVSEDGDGAKIARSETEPQQQLSLTLMGRPRGDDSSSSSNKSRRSRKDGRGTGRHAAKALGEMTGRDNNESKKLAVGRGKQDALDGESSSAGFQSREMRGRQAQQAVIHTSSHDDLKRTLTLPTLQRNLPATKRRSNTLTKDAISSSSASTGGSLGSTPNKGSPSSLQLGSHSDSNAQLCNVSSVVAANVSQSGEANRSLAVSDSSSSSDRVGTMSVSDMWSGSGVAVVPCGGQTPTVRTNSFSFDAERFMEELTRLQHDMRLLMVNSEDMWRRYEDDVAQLREEIDAVYIEVGNLTSDLDQSRKDRSHGGWNLDEKAGNSMTTPKGSPQHSDDLGRLVQLFADLHSRHDQLLWSGRKKPQHINAFFLQMLLSSATVKTGRSSLTLHSGEAAEAALAEQLQQMEEEGPLVPFEGNQLMALTPRSYSRFHSKPVNEGSFIRRGLMRAILEVSSKARRIWALYTRMYPVL